MRLFRHRRLRLFLAQPAGSLLKPAASTTSAIEPTRRAKRKPAGTAGAAEQAGEASSKSRRPTEENGKKAVPLLVDLGNATLPGIHHVWAKEEDLARYNPTTETFGKEQQYSTLSPRNGWMPWIFCGPDFRLTQAQALQHPFIKLAEKFNPRSGESAWIRTRFGCRRRQLRLPLSLSRLHSRYRCFAVPMWYPLEGTVENSFSSCWQYTN